MQQRGTRQRSRKCFQLTTTSPRCPSQTTGVCWNDPSAPQPNIRSAAYPAGPAFPVGGRPLILQEIQAREPNGAETGEAGAFCRTRQPPKQQHSSNNSTSIGANDEVPPPSLDEIASAIKQHKSNKSAGSDGLAAELFKMGPKRLTVEMHQLIVKIWEQEELPE